MSAFEHRGIVEGFYGPPWSHADRLWMLERVGRWGMNRYVYAPKDDALHRSEWRTPYPDPQLGEFAELVEHGAKAGVDVGFALSPGLSISYSSAEDRRTLVAKFRAFVDLGSRFLALALDDVPARLTHEADRACFDSLARAHVALAREVRDAFAPEVQLWFVPTDYLGVEPTDYLHVLGEELDPEIAVGWTGRTVVSPTIRAEEAARRAATLQRRLLVWDNYPVSDGPMRGMLHLAPYTGRDPGLAAHASGFLLNPMERAHASAIALHTASAFFADPEGYDPERAWGHALAEIGDGEVEAFRTFALAHRFSPLRPEDRDPELESGFARLVELLEAGEDLSPALLELRARVDVRLGAAARLREGLRDRALAREIEPWLVSHECETRRLDAALDTAGILLGPGSRSEKVLGLMRMEAHLSREPDTDRTSYGPRRVMYPQITSMREDEMSLGADPALIRNRNLVDELVEFVEDLALWLLTRGE